MKAERIWLEPPMRALEASDWADHQMLALVDSLKLTSEKPQWKAEHLDRLHDWAPSHELDPNTIAATRLRRLISFATCMQASDAISIRHKPTTLRKRR
jgi:hypothetical protein